MSKTSSKNAIELELDKLDEQWEEFLSSDQPIFRWTFPSDSLELAKTFVKVKERLVEESDDAFIILSSSFESPETYALSLAKELCHLLEEGFTSAIQEEEEKNNTSEKEQASTETSGVTWVSPKLTSQASGFKSLLECCQQFENLFLEKIDNLVLVIMPNQASDIENYTRWWEACCLAHKNSSEWPEHLKLVVFENNAAPYLQNLAEQFPEQLYSALSPSDMRGAMNDIIAKADDGSPGAKLRKHIVDLNYAVGEQNRDDIEKISSLALGIAQQNKMIDMLTSIFLIRGAGYLNMGMFDDALKDYNAAQQWALEGVEKNIPGCEKLLVQASVCEGTVLFSANRLDDAAKAYESAAKLAHENDDKLMTLEGLRMASFCLEQNKKTHESWELGIKAMQAGELMEDDQRRASTLPFVGDALLRVAPDKQAKQKVENKFNQMLGDGWLEKLREEFA